MGNKVEEQGFS